MGRRSEKIKNRKNATEMLKTKVYARCGKMLVTAVKAGGSDPVTNKALADALEFARANSVPKDNIARAIQRATSQDQADYKESTYETYAHGGAGFIIEMLTDNSNRAAAEIRGVVNKHSLKIAQPGSVGFNFDRRGVIRVPESEIEDDDEFMLAAIEAGAEECEPTAEGVDGDGDGGAGGEDQGGSYTVLTSPTALFSTKTQLEQAGYTASSASLKMVPKVFAECGDDDRERNVAAIDAFLDLDDVDVVSHNMSPE